MDEMETLTLTERMRTTTKQIHDKSDRLVNLKLALVLTSRPLYGEALALFAPIYQRLEQALERHPKLSPVASHLDKMRRFPGFEADMRFYLGEGGLESMRQRQKEGQPNELKEYLEHLDRLEREDPMLLAVYAYHMYMAVLAGGYIIRKMVKRTMGLKNDEGVRALSFPPGVDCKALRSSLKQCMNEEMDFSEDQEERVLEESVKLFELNNRLVATVQDSPAFKIVVAERIWWLQAVFAVVLALASAYWLHRK